MIFAVMKEIICFIWMLFSLGIYAQEIKTEKISQQTFSHERFVGVDKYDQIYSIHKNILYKKTAQKTYEFSVLGLGEITSVDMLNPLKLILFYKESNTVIILDDKLSEIQRIKFNNLSELKIPEFVGNSSKNKLWIFNSINQELEIFDYKSKKKIAHTQPITEQVLQMQSNFNYSWLLTPSHLKCYNIYGSFVEDFPAEGIEGIRFYNNFLIALKDGQLSVLDIQDKSFHPLNLPKIKIRNFYTYNENLYLYDGEFLYHYIFNFSK